MTVRRFPSELIGEWLAHAAGLGPEPRGLDLPKLVVQPANRPGLSAASGRARLLPPGEPQVLGFEERPMRLGERMVVARDRPGFRMTRAPWRLFGPGDPVRMVVGREPGDAGTVRLQTIRSYLNRYVMTPQHGMAGEDGDPCRTGTTGELTVRPTVAYGVRRVGKEAHDVGEWVVHPTRPADYGEVRATSQGAAVQTFRDACRLIGRALADGRTVRVVDEQGNAVPDPVIRRAVASRSAPSEVRRALVRAAAALLRRPALDPAQAVAVAGATCAAPGCLRPRTGRSPRCLEHRAQAARDRKRRHRNRTKEENP